MVITNIFAETLHIFITSNFISNNDYLLKGSTEFPVDNVIHKFLITTLIISKKPGNTGISRDIRTEFTTDLLLSD